MTTIVAMIKDNKVYMGADHLGSDGFVKTEFVKNNKLFKNGDFMIGYTTSYRMGQILEYSWAPPVRKENITDDQYFYKDVLDSIRQCFKDNDYGDKNGPDYQAGNFLVGWKGRIFEVQNAHALEHVKFASVGSGSYHALGALLALDIINHQAEPHRLLEIALDVAGDTVCTAGNGTYSFMQED